MISKYTFKNVHLYWKTETKTLWVLQMELRDAQHHKILHSGSDAMTINPKFSRSIYAATEMSLSLLVLAWAYLVKGRYFTTFLIGFEYFRLFC